MYIPLHKFLMPSKNPPPTRKENMEIHLPLQVSQKMPPTQTGHRSRNSFLAVCRAKSKPRIVLRRCFPLQKVNMLLSLPAKIFRTFRSLSSGRRFVLPIPFLLFLSVGHVWTQHSSPLLYHVFFVFREKPFDTKNSRFLLDFPIFINNYPWTN